MHRDSPALVVFGANGQLGRAIAEITPPAGWRRVLVDRKTADVTARADVERILSAVGTGVVINTAAYTAVDRAEAEPDVAFAANRDGAATVAAAASGRGLALVHLSTDYVFDGSKQAPYDEQDTPAPLSVYGASKRAGELAVAAVAPRHVILRTAWLFGRHGRNFPRTILALAQRQEEVRVVANQVGCPTPVEDLARAIVGMAPRLLTAPAGDPAFGLFHYCGDEAASWYDLAAAVLGEAASRGIQVGRLMPISTGDYPLPARRPAWSVMSCARLRAVHNVAPPSWRQRVAACLPTWLEPS